MTAIDESILQLSGDESRDMWEDINSIKPEKLRHIIYHIMCHTQNAEYRLYDTIKALTERVDKLEDRLANHFHPEPWTPKPDVLGDPEIKVAMEEWKAAKPIPGLNDGKAEIEKLAQKYTEEWLDARKLPFDTGPIPEDGKAEPDLSQRPPFVTGLSVLDSLKK